MISIHIKHALYPFLLVEPHVIEGRTTNEQSCIVGEDTQISCTFAGIEKPNVTWLFQGQPLSTNERFQISEADENTSTLCIRAIELSDRGVYTARATNSVGEAKTEIALKVHGLKPTIVTDLEDTLQAIRGEPISMTLKISGQPKPNVTWMKNNTKLIPEDNIQITVSVTDDNNIYTLTILNVQPNDQGEYFARANSTAGLTESKRCTVSVKSKHIFSHGKHDVFLFRIPDISYQTRITAS